MSDLEFRPGMRCFVLLLLLVIMLVVKCLWRVLCCLEVNIFGFLG